jgi:hypothetical protein
MLPLTAVELFRRESESNVSKAKSIARAVAGRVIVRRDKNGAGNDQAGSVSLTTVSPLPDWTFLSEALD